MADGLVESMVKLQLDEETGEMVSKSELKKRLQKRASKAAKAASQAAKEKAQTTASKAPKLISKGVEETVLDPYAMFKVGFLADVYRELPTPTVVTRFPPEPNGYLHLGHAKAIAVNFGFARFHGGKTVLRYDDTNPEGEETVYFESVRDIVKWLGFDPYEITYASDNFQKLYNYAEQLIGLGKAYMCYCSPKDIKLQRGGEEGARCPRFRCKHAEHSTETNLGKFREMRDGRYQAGEAHLRMKQDIENGNPQMWDLAAYRIPKPKNRVLGDEDREILHPRTGSKWKMYPTYDFAHCLCDSIEGITHSLCTTEFILSRESYEWLNQTLGVYEPKQREYGRLNIAGTVMSKRILKEIVASKLVNGWDDPRLFTLIAIRRRGVPPGAVLSFVNELGVTTNKTIIQVSRFEQSVRKYLERTVPRLMLVLDPIPVVIRDDDEEAFDKDIEIPLSPKDPKMGSRTIKLTKMIYIDRTDFREEDSPDYFRLAPEKIVGLLQVPYPIKAVSFSKDEGTGCVTEIQAVFDKENKKPKTYIQWVPEGSRQVEARIYGALFKSDDPAGVEGGWRNDINPNSMVVYPDALVESEGFEEVYQRAPWPRAAGEGRTTATESSPETVRFQAMRVGYFTVDSDTTNDSVVLNRIVSLKEDTGKN